MARFHLAKPPTCEKKFPDEKRRGWCVTTEKESFCKGNFRDEGKAGSQT